MSMGIDSECEKTLMMLKRRQAERAGDPADVPQVPPKAPAEWAWRHMQIVGGEQYVQATRCEPYERGCAACHRLGGYIEVSTDGYRTITDCPDCRLLIQRIKLINAARLPAKFHQRQYDWRQVRIDQERSPKAAMMAWVQDIADSYQQGHEQDVPSLCFAGPTGVGKSHAAYELAKAALANDVPVRWLNWITLLDQLRASFRDKAEHTARETWASVLRNPKGVLIIDDLGAGSVTAYSRGVACDLFERVPPHVRLIVTTNGVPNSDGEHSLDNMVGSRAASRLHGVCGRGDTMLHFHGKDWRKGAVL
jgi:DNA replication protein DnaC